MRVVGVSVFTVASLLVIACVVRSPSVQTASAAPVFALCGTERWPVKTFADFDRWRVDLTRRYRTIAQLNALQRPPRVPQNGRAPAELLTYRVVGTVTLNRNEDDGDVHLALEAGGKSIIAEAPEPACTPTARDRASITRARLVAQDVRPGDKVVAVGLGFFDFPHGQTGHADNYLELHPLISLRKL